MACKGRLLLYHQNAPKVEIKFTLEEAPGLHVALRPATTRK
jgi:hypothetical protein